MAAIVANRRFAGTEEVQPAPSAHGPQRDLRFLALPDGGFVALWTDQLETSFIHVVGQRYDSNGRKVGGLFGADTGTNQHHLNPSITDLAGGGFLVTWSATMGFSGDGVLQGQMFDSAGQKVGGVLPLHAQIADLRIAPQVIGLEGGGFVLVWGQDGPSGWDSLRGQVFTAAGAPLGAEFAVQTQFSGDVYHADIVALSGGGFVVVWDMNQAEGTPGNYNAGVRAQRFDSAGAKLGGEIAVNTSVPMTQDWPAVAALPGDGFVVAWRDDNGTGGVGFRIKTQMFDSAGAKVGAEIIVDPGSPAMQSAPTISSNAAGEFVVGWTQFDPGSTSDVKARMFDSSGTPIGNAFTVNALTSGHQDQVELAMLASGALLTGFGTSSLTDMSDVKLRLFFPVAAGTAGDDTITGTPGRNFVEGLDGNDSLSGGLEDDGLFGNSGNDTLDGQEGNDELDGGDGNDILTGGAGNDSLDSGAGNDSLDGGEGNDALRVSLAGTDSAAGGAGSDTLFVSYGDATTAVISGPLAPVAPDGGLSGSISAADRSVSFTGIEGFHVTTGSGDDDIRTGSGYDIVSLGAGNDRVDMGTGLGNADGGSGLDGIAADLSSFGQLNWWLPQSSFGINNLSIPNDLFRNFEYFAAVVTGSGNDSLITTAFALDDDITTGGGNDSVWITHGHDVVRAGTGNDTLSMDYSGDTAGIVTIGFAASADGTGYDGKYGSAGRSITFTGVETFSMSTGSGNDVIRTGAGQDSIWTLGGDDFVDVGTGPGDLAHGGDGIDGISADLSGMTTPVSWNLVTGVFALGSSFGGFEYLGTLTTGSSNDTIVTSNLDRDEIINTVAGSDIVTVMNGDDVVNAGSGGDDRLIVDYRNTSTSVVSGPLAASSGGGYDGRVSAGDRAVDFTGVERFTIFGGSAADDLKGGAGNDSLNGGGGIDTMAGGAGNDVYTVDNAADVVIENAGEGTDTISTALAAYSLANLPNIENLSGAVQVDQSLTGNANNNVVTAGAGNDFLYLWVGGGNDTVTAGGGNDAIFFGATLTGNDIVNGGSGGDTLVLQGPYGALTLTANVTQIENISILGGNNTAFGEPGTNRHDYVLTIHDANFAAGVQSRINAAALQPGEDFTFDGSAETDASFVVYGGKGRDTLTGGLGNDIFFFAEERFASGDTVNGGAGYNGMFLRGNYTIDFNAPGYTGLFTNIHNLTLTSATDERYARGGGTEFDYNLTLSDAIVGAGGQLTVSGALLLATETMVLDASAETDGTLRLFGGKASDILKGGALNDLLHGNLGADTLAGGGGADAFRFQNVAESSSGSMDQILDFTPGTDRIELDRIDADTLTAGNQAFSWIGSNAFSGTAGELRAYEQSGTWFVEGDTNGDGAADLVIALTLQGPTPLSAGDFLL